MSSDIPPSVAELRHPKLWLSLKIILPLVVLILGATALVVMIETAPTAGRQPPTRGPRLVEVAALDRVNTNANITAMGVVHPAREVTLQPQVSGKVQEMHPELIPGGFKEQGDVLLTIEAADYEIAVRKAESELATAESGYALEMGQQASARSEFALLGGDGIAPEERALILREPQLARARANLDNARAVLDQARLNLERTRVTAPFNAVIRERHVNIGAHVTPSTPLVTLTDADAYWILVPVPVAQLAWIAIPERPGDPASTVRVLVNRVHHREGRVLRRLTNLEEGGRMAQLLIEVEDPLARQPGQQDLHPLLIGDFVRVEISGRELAGVIPLDRRWLRPGDRVWIMNNRDQLEIRPVQIRFRGEHEVLVEAGLEPGDRIVLTDLAAPVEGMKLSTGRTDARPPRPEGGGVSP